MWYNMKESILERNLTVVRFVENLSQRKAVLKCIKELYIDPDILSNSLKYMHISTSKLLRLKINVLTFMCAHTPDLPYVISR